MDEETYSVSEAAEILDFTPGRLRQLLRDGALEAHQHRVANSLKVEQDRGLGVLFVEAQVEG